MGQHKYHSYEYTVKERTSKVDPSFVVPFRTCVNLCMIKYRISEMISTQFRLRAAFSQTIVVNHKLRFSIFQQYKRVIEQICKKACKSKHNPFQRPQKPIFCKALLSMAQYHLIPWSKFSDQKTCTLIIFSQFRPVSVVLAIISRTKTL